MFVSQGCISRCDGDVDRLKHGNSVRLKGLCKTCECCMIVKLQGVPTAERIDHESTPLGLPTGYCKGKKETP